MTVNYKYVLLILELIAVIVAYRQSDYIFTFERIQLTEANKKHIVILKAATNKYNRTQAVLNATFEFKTSFKNDLELNFHAYKFSSNEYRSFPIEFNLNLCNMLSSDDFGIQNIYDCGSFPRCPIQKGLYVLCNWYPDSTKFPPYVPNGRYMAVINVNYHTEQAFKVIVYYAVEKIMKYT